VRTLQRAFDGLAHSGRRLHLPWPNLDSRINLRTQEIVLIVGGPGSGKSTFAVNWCMNTTDPVLYLAQDSPVSIVTRMAALAARIPVLEASRRLAAGDRTLHESAGRRKYLVVERGAQTVPRIEQKVEALTEWLGRAPSLVILDNLIDLSVPGLNFQDPGFYATALPALKQLAISKDMCIVCLHHITKTEKESGIVPLALADTFHAGGREARHVWGIYHSEDQRHMWLQPLKQNDGEASAAGRIRIQFTWDVGLGTVTENAW